MSAISAFNASYDTNAWGKRTADTGTIVDDPSSPTKRQQLDTHQQPLSQETHLQLDPSALHDAVSFNNVSVTELQVAVAAVAERHQQHQQHQHQHQHQHLQQPQIMGAPQQEHQGGDMTDRLQSEEAEYEDDEDVDDSPFQTHHQDHLMNPFGQQHDWTTPKNLMDDSTAVLWSANHGMRVRSLPVVDNLVSLSTLTIYGWILIYGTTVDANFNDTGEGWISGNT